MKKYPSRSHIPLRFMKNGQTTCLTLFLFIATLFQIYADPGSQGERLSLELEGVTLEKALGEIESSTEYRFMYEYGQIPLKKIVSLKTHNQEMDVILSLLFKNMPIDYKIQGRQVILTKSPYFTGKEGTSMSFPAQATLPQTTVTGTVLDGEGMPLLGAN